MRFLGLIIFSSLINADDSWIVYDDSSVARVEIYVDSLALDWMYEYDNVESDSMHEACLLYTSPSPRDQRG